MWCETEAANTLLYSSTGGPITITLLYLNVFYERSLVVATLSVCLSLLK